jgi:hypothetical protein
VKPKELSWQEVCADPSYAPTIRRYRSFEAFLDNEDELETILPTAEMLEHACPAGTGAEAEEPSP